jgi:hypothetical protein
LVTISSGLCCLFAIFDPPFPNYTGGPFLWGRTRCLNNIQDTPPNLPSPKFALSSFSEREGHCRVPNKYTTEDGFRLGTWLSTQRVTRDKLLPERRALLEVLGFVWDPLEAAWNEAYAHLKVFSQREGHCLAPVTYTTEDGFKLGRWVSTQRTNHKNLAVRRTTLLDDLDFIWNAGR